jgi:hypothetical protein
VNRLSAREFRLRANFHVESLDPPPRDAIEQYSSPARVAARTQSSGYFLPAACRDPCRHCATGSAQKSLSRDCDVLACLAGQTLPKMIFAMKDELPT